MLVNTIGHSAGVLIFGIFLYLFLRDARGARLGRSTLPAVAAALALLWNLGSLIALATLSSQTGSASIPAAFSFSVLSFLPAVLLHISLGDKRHLLRYTGYAVSCTSVILHIAERLLHDGRLHEYALLLISFGFGALTLASVLASPGSRVSSTPMRGLVGMALFILATSFVHFGGSHSHHLWSEEIALHHAGIPLALFVLLQEHRFLLMDAFVRFLTNAFLAAGLIGISLALDARFGLLARSRNDEFFTGLLIVATCLTLIVFSQFRSVVQGWLTRVVFRRAALPKLLQSLTSGSEHAGSEGEFLATAAHRVADYVGADTYELRPVEPGQTELPLLPQPTSVESEPWVKAMVPLHFSRGDVLHLLLGRRAGGRRYLSEDLNNLAQIALSVVGQVERFRAGELNRLAAEADMRALQAQINPHFLFNALNALYGTIPRQAEGARKTVLNLADIFRFFLQSDKTSIPLSEELRIVHAYLEVEKLRLGERLQTFVDVEEDAASIRIPALSIQPLVENAVRHGVARHAGPGSVRVSIHTLQERLRIEVADTGGSFDPSAQTEWQGCGVGLDNVRQRLRLCFGDRAQLTIRVEEGSTVVTVELPIEQGSVGTVGELSKVTRTW